jgi:hypothetical protein
MGNKTRKKKDISVNQPGTYTRGIEANARTEHLTKATEEWLDAINRIDDPKKLLGNQLTKHGEAAEILDVAKWKADALRKGRSKSINLDQSRTSDTDYWKGSTPVQSKIYNSSTTTLKAVREHLEKYPDFLNRKGEYFVPSDQVEAVINKLKSSSDPSDHILAKKIKPSNYKYEDIRDHTSGEHKYLGTAQDEYYKSLMKEVGGCAWEAGKMGAAVGGGLSTVKNTYQVAIGEKDFGEAVVQISKDTANTFISSAAVGGLGKGISHVAGVAGKKAGNAVIQANLKAFAKSNAPMAVAAGVIESGKSLASYMRGEIDKEQLLDEVGHTTITATSSFYWAAAGQALIPIPFVGAMAGSMVGYLSASMLYQSGVLALGDTVEVKIAKQRLKFVKSLCLQAIPNMQQNRAELETLIDTHFAERKDLLNSQFDGIDNAILSWNPNDLAKNLCTISEAFGQSLPFKDFEEFDHFMLDDSKTLEF